MTSKKTLQSHPNDSARKFDGEKTRLELVPPRFIEGIGEVLTFGAQKYDAHNWMKGLTYSRIIGAIKRHTLAIEMGEDYDPESGMLHAYHVATNLAFLSHFMEQGRTDLDDRVFKRKVEPNEQ